MPSEPADAPPPARVPFAAAPLSWRKPARTEEAIQFSKKVMHAANCAPASAADVSASKVFWPSTGWIRPTTPEPRSWEMSSARAVASGWSLPYTTRRCIAMQLHQRQADSLADAGDLIQRRVDEYPCDLDPAAQRGTDRLRLGQRAAPRRSRVEHHAHRP